MVFETLLGVAIVAAVIGVICFVKASLPASAVSGVERVTVLKCCGEAVGLEEVVRETAPGETVYILDDGMTGEARRRAGILAKRLGARILTRDEIREGIGRADGG